MSDDDHIPSSDSEQEWSEEEDAIPMIGTGFPRWLVIVRGWAYLLQLITCTYLQTRLMWAGVDTEGCRFLTEDVMAEVVVMLGDKVQYKFDSGHIELKFVTSSLPLLTQQALGLADVLTIVVELIFDSPSFGAGSEPRCDVRYIKRDIPPVEPQPQDIPEPDTAAPLMYDPLGGYQETVLGPEETDEAALAEPVASPDSSESDADDPMKIPKYKRPVVATVAYQFANIIRKKLADEWPETRHFTWQQAKQWIPQLHTKLVERLATLGDHCIICDDKQPLSGIKPVACSKSLCSHQFDEMGYGASMDIIYHSPNVADLLISMAAAAASNDHLQHRQRFFACPNPPSDFVDDHARALVNDSNNTMGINWDELQLVLGNLPSVEKMAKAKDLQKFLNKYHKHAYRLVRWILSTCRGHIVELQPKEQIAGHQFKLFTNTFERELAFKKLKREQGSFFMFHGSPFMKWHSIMRTCLQNFSNTQFMTTGAAHGSGVYTASNSSTSLAYCRVGQTSGGYKASIFGDAASCIALVEVAGNEKSIRSSIHVVPNHDAVVARYFFVYGCGCLAPPMDTQTMKIPAWDASS